ncbi:MAG TPA: selenium cofactor biosynthesis protein YqeC, partial [Thermodesulfobacteriota bacterium]|nr:selenium cofactor biosynthesis protein YqeC [Thermodesulfobacteriota bacterium]
RIRNRRVVTTTTTKIYPPSREESPCLLLGGREVFPAIKETLVRSGHLTLAAQRTTDKKLAGVSLADLSHLCALGWADYLILEADGSSRRPIKGPHEHEPVGPLETGTFISVLGLSALGQPLNPERAFRPEIIARLTAIQPGNPITAEGLATLAAHPQGGLKGRGPGMRAVVFLNQWDSQPDNRTLRHLAESILFKGQGQIERVLLGQLKPKIRLIVTQL